MICLVALVTLCVLGLFSAKYRSYTREAFDCVFRRLTLRKCNTAFDKKVKARVSAKVMKRNKALGGLVFKHFEAIGWVFTILLVVSLAYSSLSLYNLAVYGTCDLQQPDTCVFTASPGPSCGSEDCATEGCNCDVEGCEEPDFEACNGDCDCLKEVCG